ncbi:hypothetical protein GOBAR_DD14657 [Gossypium barbadense]|nr:hypothetical protein GOBAR_DD14657 [Gossypium barbadense]
MVKERRWGDFGGSNREEGQKEGMGESKGERVRNLGREKFMDGQVGRDDSKVVITSWSPYFVELPSNEGDNDEKERRKERRKIREIERGKGKAEWGNIWKGVARGSSEICGGYPIRST